MTWVHQKGPCDISQCLIWDFDFPIEWRCIYACSLNYYVNVMTCTNKSRRSCQCKILIHWYECNFLIRITQCSDKLFEYFKRRPFASGCEPKRVWLSITDYHKIWCKSTDIFNTEKREIHLKHEPRSTFWDVNGQTSGNLSCLGQESNRKGILQVRDICWNKLHESFSIHSS